jgi:hypothetical protein
VLRLGSGTLANSFKNLHMKVFWLKAVVEFYENGESSEPALREQAGQWRVAALLNFEAGLSLECGDLSPLLPAAA